MNSPTIMHAARKLVELYGDSNKLTPLKLQKLAYYCQAWTLVWEEQPLFPEDFRAWANGPVNPELYKKHKGTYVIEKDFLSESSGFKFTEAQLHTIETVLRFYGPKEAFFLSELTHKERPWKEARGSTPPGAPSDAIITKESMQEYYTGISTA